MTAIEIAAGTNSRQPPQSRRLGVGVLALAVAISIHGLAWLALQAKPAAHLPATLAWAQHQPERRALIVELIASQPKPPMPMPMRPASTPPPSPRSRLTAAHNGTRVQPRRSAHPAHSSSADAASNDEAQRAAIVPKNPVHGVPVHGAPARDVDWQADLQAIGSSRPAVRSAAEAAIGALSASSGAAALRNDTSASNFARQVSKAARADCRRAYAQMGLLAIPALALDAVRDNGCKW